jgi:ligand-binding sensor domain-containing protein
MDDGILEIAVSHNKKQSTDQASIGSLNEVEQLLRSNSSLYAVTAGGVYLRRGAGTWSRVLVPASSLLTDRNVSALAIDTAGQLWVGYFDRGLDIVDPSQQRVRHIEDDHVFCINRILPAAGHNASAVATANGLVLFDAQGNRKQALGKADGLIADHVTDVAAYGNDLVAATPAGLTFMGPNGVRSLYAFHGLVNNHVYTLSPNGRLLLAGTLGGASLLENDQVRASLTTATSKLKANWITAAVATGSEWWVGTYGAGIAHLDPTGHIEPSDGASGDLVINPNAMIAGDRYVAAGSMGHGLYVMNTSTDRWTAITEGLPSLNVTALARGSGYLYVGTDNGLVRIPEQRLGR